eukprot:COSAG06_NODE_145_length_22208_cov_30.535664_13_plen_128_part_00
MSLFSPFYTKRAQHTVLPPRTKLRKHRLNRHFAPQSATPLRGNLQILWDGSAGTETREVAEWRISERYFEPADRNLGSRRRTQDKQRLRTKLRNTLRELQRAEPGSWTRPDRSTCEVYRKRRRPRRP